MNILITQDEFKIAERIARRTAARWSLSEYDDVKSHLHLWLVEHPVVVERYREDANGPGKLYTALRREAAKYAANEQEARVGRPLHDDSQYSAAMVARVLPFIFQDWPQNTVPVNPVTGKPTSSSSPESGLAFAILADISGAYHGLDKDTKTVLAWRFRDDLTFAEIAQLAGITESGVIRRVDRAVQRIASSLSGDRY